MDEDLWVDGTLEGRTAGEDRSAPVCENLRNEHLYFGLLGGLVGLSVGWSWQP